MTNPLKLPDLSFTRTQLPNGLGVVVRHDPRLPVVAVNLWYHVGSKNEERRQRGYAHLFEHLMFEGSGHFPGDFFKPLQRLGAAVNGSTSTDRTNYFVDIPSAHAELAVAMESDRMAHLIPALTDHKLRVQKDVVKNEYRQNYANRPYGQVWALMAEALYPPDHPYSWLTIGSMEDVEAATRDDVEAFFRKFYVPANASLCLAGDIREDDALALAERYFGPITGGSSAVRPRAPEVRLTDHVELRLHDRVELERVYAAWPTTPMFHADDAPLTILADILTRGKSGRLYRSLVKDRQLAQDVSAYQSARELAGTFGIYMTLRPGRSAAEARAIVDAELESVASNGVEPDELERVKNGRLAGFFYALDSVGGFGGVADRLNAYNVYLGDPGRITSDFERFQNVRPEDVQAVAARYLAGRFRLTLTVENRKAVPAGTTPPALDRAAPIASRPAAPFRAPVPAVRTLRCGLTLWAIPCRELPIVSSAIVLAGGAARRGGIAPGLAQLTASMMDEGTTTRTTLQIAEAAERMGTLLSTSCGWDGSYVSFQCLSPHLDASLELAVDVLLNPTFPAAEFERVYGQTLAALRAERDSAEARANRRLLAELFPAGHPYRIPVDGDESSVSAFTRDHVAQFHRDFHGPTGAGCVVAGDIDPDAFAEELDRRLGSWSGRNADIDDVARPALGGRPRVVVAHRPGAAQAAVRVGHVGIARHDPDYTDLQVFNQILGGQFTSRLNAKLREEKGFTYGIRSHFDGRRGAGPFVISAALQTDRLAEALDDLRNELLALLDSRPPTQAELDDARRSLIEGQARHFETPSAIVSRYAGLLVHNLPPDYHTHAADRLNAVTIESLHASAKRHIYPDSLVYVVVADADLVSEPLSRLDWAGVEAASE